ncbi:MAG: metalloregulator ArsR/SmtB family transcription factor [Verrucomicrobiota bacterium]|nr:metalloregulator ArsR/SmtB family transcription factor [Verrucomicrobiota bacterium]
MASGAELKFQAFSDPIRLRILFLLRKQEMCVCDLVAVLKVPQPTASRHLARLRKSGLVKVRKEGFWTFYSLTTPRSKFEKSLIACLDHCASESPGLENDQTLALRLLKRGKCCPA